MPVLHTKVFWICLSGFKNIVTTTDNTAQNDNVRNSDHTSIHASYSDKTWVCLLIYITIWISLSVCFNYTTMCCMVSLCIQCHVIQWSCFITNGVAVATHEFLALFDHWSQWEMWTLYDTYRPNFILYIMYQLWSCILHYQIVPGLSGHSQGLALTVGWE